MSASDDIYGKVTQVLVESLNVDEGDVTPTATLQGDLGAESIDFLDIVFRLEREFGIRIPRGELFPESVFQGDPDFVRDGRVWYALKALGAHPGSATDDSVTSNREMVDIPASAVTQLPQQRLARSETTSGRLVQVLQGSSSRLFARKNTPETVSSPRSRTNWLAEVVGLSALAQ